MLLPHISAFCVQILTSKRSYILTLYSKLSKCSFFQEQVEFLGHVVDKDGVQMDAKSYWPSRSGLHKRTSPSYVVSLA